MTLYWKLDFDGRAQRAAAALAPHCDLQVLALDSGRAFAPDGYRLATLALPGHRGGFAVSLWRYMRFVAWIVREAVRQRPTVIYGHDFFSALPGVLAAGLAGSRLVYDAHELLVPDPRFPQSGRDRFFRWMERRAVRRAAAVIAASEERARAMADYYRLVRPPTVVANISPKPVAMPTEAPLPPAPPGVFRIVYQGGIDGERGLEPFVAAIAGAGDDIELVLIGDGPARPALERLIAENGGTNRTRWLGFVAHHRIPALLAGCHAGIVSYVTHNLNTHYCAPNKIYDYAQAGLPVLATAQPPLRRLVEAGGIGVVVETGSLSPTAATAAAAAALAMLRSDWNRYRQALPAFVAAHSWENERARLEGAVLPLIGIEPSGSLPGPCAAPSGSQAGAE